MRTGLDMTLQDEIDLNRKTIHTDGYPMSIGELVNLYRDGELDLHPEFQRFYRWNAYQKSRWIESILLGIPLPSIFVVQRSDGVWDVVDGLQRLSAVFELMGELKDENGNATPLLQLEGTKYLPSLQGKKWKGSDGGESLTAEQHRFIKRTKLDVKIILRESHQSTKYELFQRLNTGGSALSEQEVRSCVLIGVNRKYYKWISDLAKNDWFQSCLPITDRQRSEQYDLELAIRFVVLRNVTDTASISTIRELGEYLTDQSVAQASDSDFPYELEEEIFEKTFGLLLGALESDSFRRYDGSRDRFTGGFLISAFEIIALGLGYNYATFSGEPKDVVRLVKEKVWEIPVLDIFRCPATQRLPRTLPFGREVFR